MYTNHFHQWFYTRNVSKLYVNILYLLENVYLHVHFIFIFVLLTGSNNVVQTHFLSRSTHVLFMHQTQTCTHLLIQMQG